MKISKSKKGKTRVIAYKNGSDTLLEAGIGAANSDIVASGYSDSIFKTMFAAKL